MTRDTAQIIALEAIGWLATDDDLMALFLMSTGCTAETLKSRVNDPEFLISVLDFILMDDKWVIKFCKAVPRDPSMLRGVRTALYDDDEIHWI